MKKRKMIDQELGVRDCLGFVLLFILKRDISWEYGKIQGGGSVVGTTNGKYLRKRTVSDFIFKCRSVEARPVREGLHKASAL